MAKKSLAGLYVIEDADEALIQSHGAKDIMGAVIRVLEAMESFQRKNVCMPGYPDGQRQFVAGQLAGVSEACGMLKAMAGGKGKRSAPAVPKPAITKGKTDRFGKVVE